MTYLWEYVTITIVVKKSNEKKENAIMATYLDEMFLINKKFVDLFPDNIIYWQYDNEEIEFNCVLNGYLIDLLHNYGMESTYDSLMKFSKNSHRWNKEGYGYNEYMSENCSICVEIESWKTPITEPRPKYGVKPPNAESNYWYKFDYRVYRQVNSRTNKMQLVFETHYEYKLINYLLDKGFNKTMDKTKEVSLEEEETFDEIASKFIRICKKFKMAIEDDYIYGYIRKYVYCETYEEDMGCVNIMLYNKKTKDWEVVYNTYDMKDLFAKLKYIHNNKLWSVSMDKYDKNDIWWD